MSNNASKGLVSMDWGNIFDILSIFNVKINHCVGNALIQNVKNFKEMESEVKKQIGLNKFIEIMESPEYKDLYESNLYTFNKVSEAQKSTGIAKEVDDGNKMRFASKAKLQKKFFGTEVSEVKV